MTMMKMVNKDMESNNIVEKMMKVEKMTKVENRNTLSKMEKGYDLKDIYIYRERERERRRRREPRHMG